MTLQAKLDNEFEKLDWMFSGMESLLCTDKQSQFDSMTGNESYYALHFDANSYAGNEASIGEGIKKAASTLYSNIIDIIKRVREYFFGEGEKAAENAVGKAEGTVDNLSELRADTPIAADHPSRNPENYIKSLEGGTEFEELKKDNADIGSMLDKLKSTASKVTGCDTVGKLRAVYAEMTKAGNSGIQTVSSTLRKTLSSAESTARKLKSPSIPKDDDTPEVKAGIKQENQEVITEAKADTVKARLVGGVRNKVVGTLNAISKFGNGIKEKPAEPKFKG